MTQNLPVSIKTIVTKTFESTTYLLSDFKDCINDLEPSTNLKLKVNQLNLNKDLSCMELLNTTLKLLETIETNNNDLDFNNELLVPLKINYNNLQVLQTLYFQVCYYQQEQDLDSCTDLDTYFETIVKEQVIKDFDTIKSLFN